MTNPGASPTDIFNGGSGGFNIAVMPDARSDYTITTQVVANNPNITTIASNGDDAGYRRAGGHERGVPGLQYGLRSGAVERHHFGA